jgi:transposase-like protein
MADSLIAECSVRCPFCAAESAELVSLFGSQLLLSQYRCKSCGSYFEGLREDRWEPQPQPEPEPKPDRSRNRSSRKPEPVTGPPKET